MWCRSIFSCEEFFQCGKKNLFFSMPPQTKAFFVSSCSKTNTLASSSPALSRKRCTYLCHWIKYAFNYNLFAEAVPWKALELLDYPSIISDPMDFHTLYTYVQSSEFTFSTFLEKSRLIWNNACLYNPEGHVVNTIAKRLRNTFEEKIISMQKYPTDEDPCNICNQLCSLILSFFQEDMSKHFVNFEDIPENYAKHVDVHLCFQNIVDDLYEMKYCNRYDVEYDFNFILNNAISYYSSTNLVSVSANMTKQVGSRLFHSRLSDCDSLQFVSNEMRHQLADNVQHLTNTQRLEFVKELSQLCPDAISRDQHCSSISIDMLSRSQFLKMDMKMKSMFTKSCISL